MRESNIKIYLPEFTYRLRLLFILAYRRFKYGYTFRKIHLTQDEFAIVDPQDYQSLSKYKWCAGKYDRRFYALRKNGSKNGNAKGNILMHRQILNASENKIIDHINHNGLDNRRANLRFVTPRQNSWNARKRRNCSSQYKGVYFHKRDRRWLVNIVYKGRRIYLGCFKNEHSAALAYDKKAKELFKQYAVLNFPES